MHKVRKRLYPNPVFGSHRVLDFNIKSGKDGTWTHVWVTQGIRFQHKVTKGRQPNPVFGSHRGLDFKKQEKKK